MNNQIFCLLYKMLFILLWSKSTRYYIMKYLLSCILLLSFFFSKAQDLNYSIIRTDGQYHYTKYEPTDSYKSLVTQDYQLILETDSGRYYKSYPYAFEQYEGDEHEYVDANTSAFGDSIFIDNEGNTTIYTANSKRFFFKKPSGDYESWIIYTDEYGNYLKGRNRPFRYSTFYPYLPGIIDSVAELNIFVYDSTNTQISSNLKTDILISKNFGVNKILPFNDIVDLTKNYQVYTAVGIERDNFNEGFSLKNAYEDVFLSLEIGNEVHVKYEDFSEGYYHYEIRKVIGKEVGDSLVHYTFQYCDSLSSDTVITSEVVKTYYYKMRNRELINAGILSDKTYFQDVTDFYLYDWNGKNYFKFYSRQTDEFETNNNRNYWLFWYPDQISNYGTAYYEFIEELGVIVVDKWDGNYLLDEIHYFKTSTEEWGTPFSHSCSDNTDITEILQSQIKLYPNPAEDVIQIESPQEIDAIQIYDLQGRLVKSEELNGRTSLNVSDLDAGLYIIEIQMNNKALAQQKILIY